MNPWLILGALVLWAASVAGAWQHGYEAGQKAEIDKAAAAALTESETRRLQARERATTAERIDREALAKTRAAEAAAGSRRAVGDGLRLALAADRQPAGADAGECAAERARSRILADLLEQGSRLVEEGAGIVDDAVIRVDGLQERGRP